MMTSQEVDSNWLVADVFERFPQTLPVFIHWNLDCYGCSMAQFCTLRDAAEDYHLDLDAFLRAINQSIQP